MANLHSHTVFKDFFRFPRDVKSFPFVAEHQPEGAEWMTDEQETVTNIYGWAAVGVLAIVLLFFITRWYKSFESVFRGTYKACGADQEIAFSDVPSISTYVPQVDSPVFSYPLL